MHQPVLLQEVLEWLNPSPSENVVDCTIGDGGHAAAILKRIGPKGRLLGIDWDPQAIDDLKAGKGWISKNDLERVILVNENFKEIASIVAQKKFQPVNKVLLDLGFSSSTLERGRGFSFQKDEFLDMRFNPKVNEITAFEIINSWPEEDLAGIFKEYGEEKLANLIAEAIVNFRKQKTIKTTFELSEIVLDVYRKKLGSRKKIPWIGGLHPATKVFQALRITVNDELKNLQEALPEIIEILEPAGRLAVISFHSLEDRIVKMFFKSENQKSLNILTKKPIQASQEEIEKNPQARSAKLRVVEKLI